MDDMTELDEFEGDDEPGEEDYVTSDHRVFRDATTGRIVLEVSEGEVWEPVMRLKCESDGFFPGVWFVSDHGNVVALPY